MAFAGFEKPTFDFASRFPFFLKLIIVEFLDIVCSFLLGGEIDGGLSPLRNAFGFCDGRNEGWSS